MSTETGRPAAPASLTYLPRLDGLRGFAVLLVVMYHTGYLTAGWGPRPFPGGFIGVDLFFALSGFLITTLLLGQLERRGRINFTEFWSRRIRRLVPALVVAVVGVIALVALVGDNLSGEALRNAGSGSVLFVSNCQQGAVGLVVCVCFDLETGDSRLYHGWFSIVAVSCATLVVTAVLEPGWGLHRWWSQRWLMALGHRSYSLYLWHVPIFLLVAEHLGN